MPHKSPEIIIALDNIEVGEAFFMAHLLSDPVWGFKINDLLLEAGTTIIPRLKRFGHVFADVKLHDTPNTVSNSVKKLSRAGADFISVHATDDIGMLVAAEKAAEESKIIGISVLTSNGNVLKSMFRKAVFQSVVSRAYGLVCSPRDLKLFRQCPGSGTLRTLSPGVRPSWSEILQDDQKRIATPADAARAGVDYIIIGRPVTEAKKPKEALDKVMKELEEIKTPR